MADFYSQAFNFPGAIQGGVDPRTGLYVVNMPVARLVGNANLGPSLDLTLRYDPLGGAAPGIGYGFTLGLSQYDAGNKLLTLSTGDRYKVNETSTSVTLQQNRLDTVRFEKITSGTYAGYYKITHKSGHVELLRNDAFSIKVPAQIFGPTGRRLDLAWEQSGTTRRLIQVKDETTVLFKASYADASSTLTIWPDQSESYALRLVFQNGYLSQVENTSQTPSLAWALTYDTIGGARLLTKLQSPTGLIEQVIYQPGATAFPPGAGLPALPRVTSYTQYPQGNQPAIARTYHYSVTNFLGASASGGRWDPNRDYLYDILTSYSYWSREISVCSGRTMTIERTYDNFHLQTKEVVSQGSYARTTETSYYARIGAAVEQQQPQFQLPRSSTVTFSKNGGESSRSEVTETEFDTAGNMTRQVTPDGTETVWVYYPASGEAGGCPADPNGFIRFPKTQTVTPPTVGGYDAPTEVTVYAYGSLPAVAGTPVTTAVVKLQEELSRSGQLLHRTDYAYVADAGSPELGRMTRLTQTLYVPGGTPSSYASQTDFTFTRQGGELAQAATTTTHDGLSTTRRRSQSSFSGRLLSETDPWGIETRYTYDSLGRILSRTSNPGTAFETVQSYAYDLLSGSLNTSSTTVTDVRGNQTRRWVDALGREVRRERLDADGTLQGWLTIAARSYDAWGRLATATQTDVLRPDTGTTGTTVSGTKTFGYDDWGGNDLTTLPDGHQKRTAYDPVILQSDTGIVDPSQGRQVTVYNLLHLPVTVTHVDHTGTAQGQIRYAYDGLGRLRSLTDELGHVTSYDYDAWDRIATVTLPDGTVVQKTYAPDSNGALLTGIAVADRSLGTQRFDGLGRKLAAEVAGEAHGFTYDGDLPVPRLGTLPGGGQATFAYQRELGFAPTQVSADGLVQTFQYDPAGGLLTCAAQGGGAVRTITYYPSGLLSSETFKATADANTSRKASYFQSLRGRLQTYTDVAGATQRFTYDCEGRASGMTDPDMSMTMAYDQLGRLSSWTVTDLRSDATVTTTLGYDDFGREIRRELSGSTALTITQAYRANGQISRRTTMEGAVTLRDETYGYDERNRLTSYTCNGSGRPVDASGRPVAAMDFTYDALGNITKCVTTLDDGSDTAIFLHDAADPTRLTAVIHSHPGYPQRIDLAYDAAGRMTRDEAGRTLDYDPFGRLASVTGGGADAAYSYDATDRMIAEIVGGTDRQEFYYRSGQLVNVIGGATGPSRIIRMGGQCLAQRRDGAQAATTLFGTDGTGTILVATGHGDYAYTPFGYRPTTDAAPLGYHGERQDPVTGATHLGNGYRAYNPVLMRFNTPDDWSPFGAGGINRYAYCAGDPINRVDPSGHLSVGAWIGIGLGVVGIIATVATFGLAAAPVIAAEGVVAGLAAGASAVGVVGGLGLAADITGIVSGALEEAAPEASAILGWVSMGLGAPGAMEGLAKLGGTVGRRVGNSLAELSERVATIQREGLSGRGAPNAARALAAVDHAPGSVAPGGQREGLYALFGLDEWHEGGTRVPTGEVRTTQETSTRFEGLRNNGQIDAAQLLAEVPKGMKNVFKIEARSQRGFKYIWTDLDGVQWTVSGHEADAGAAAGYVGAQDWTVRIKRRFPNRPEKVLMNETIIPPVGDPYDWNIARGGARNAASHIPLTNV
ncbi:RHS repeat-associated core domain-containing protein [Sorangium sp. So ce134]